MKKTLIIKRIIFGSLLLFTFGLIFYYSNSNGNSSHGLSEKVTRIIADILHLTENNREIFISNAEPYIRKLAHFSIYALAGIWEMLFLNTFNIKDEKKLFLGALIGIVYALSDEFHQSFTPGRSPKIIDIVIDSEGNLFGNLFILLFIIFIRNKKEEA